jgi:hypothetical protein
MVTIHVRLARHMQELSEVSRRNREEERQKQEEPRMNAKAREKGGNKIRISEMDAHQTPGDSVWKFAFIRVHLRPFVVDASRVLCTDF